MLRKYHKSLDHVMAALLLVSKGKVQAGMKHLETAMENQEEFDDAMEDLQNAQEFARLAEINPSKLLKAQLASLSQTLASDADSIGEEIPEEDDADDEEVAKILERIQASQNKTVASDEEELDEGEDEIELEQLPEMDEESEDGETDDDEEAGTHCSSAQRRKIVAANLKALSSLIEKGKK